MQKPRLVRTFFSTLTLASFRFCSRSFSSQSPSTFAAKKVTRNNFDSILDDLRRHVRDAVFVAIDLEMTGLTSAPWRESFEFDRFDVRYLKVKDSAEKFAVIQFGVCPFSWDNSKGTFIAHPYNFYIFPRKELPVDVPSFEFLCQTTSLDFLAKYQFDFNACIHEGISYLSREQEAQALRRLDLAFEEELGNSGYDPRESVEIPFVSTADFLFTERMKSKFYKWRDGLLWNPNIRYQLQGNPDDCNTQFRTAFFKMRPSLVLDGFNSHQLRLIQQVVRKHFKDLTYVRLNGENSSEEKYVVYTESEDGKALFMKEVRKDLLKEAKTKVEAAVGFRHVIDLLSSERKLIVGHNCLLDLAHVHNKFFGPLPPTIVEFASSLHKNFPYIIDTKHLLMADRVIQQLMKKSSTTLSSAFAHLCPQILSHLASPRVKVEVQADEVSSSIPGSKHEAGYDAFMTGCVFAQSCYYLGIDFKLHPPLIELAEHECLQKHINLLFLGWNCGSVIDLRTGNEVLKSGFRSYKQKFRSIMFTNIVLVWGFHAKFKPINLRQTICKVFGADSVTSVYYLDETSAFVQFSKNEFVSAFLLLKDTLEKSSDPLSVLHPLAKLLEGGKTRAANYNVYKQICSSPISRIFFSDQAEAVGIRWEEEELGVTELESSSECAGENFDTDSLGTSKKKEILDDTHCHFPGEQILDALYATNSLLEKRSRTM